MELVTAGTRAEFMESFSSRSVLAAIDAAFRGAGLSRAPLDPEVIISGRRRTLVAEFYQAVDWTSRADVRKVLNAYELHLRRMTGEGWDAEVQRLVAVLWQDNLVYESGRIEFAITEAMASLVDPNLALDLSQVRVQVDRIRASANEDPDLAIGSAKDLVEATCKAILVSRGHAVRVDEDLSGHMNAVTTELGLVPADRHEAERGSRSVNRVLGGLRGIGQGMAELRQVYAKHGRAPGEVGLSPRHARLAANAAAALALFLVESAVEQDAGQATPDRGVEAPLDR